MQCISCSVVYESDLKGIWNREVEIFFKSRTLITPKLLDKITKVCSPYIYNAVHEYSDPGLAE
jgi:hypothetical protein